MARPRNPNRDIARELWRKSNGEAPLEEIAKELGEPAKRLLNWMRLDDWKGARQARGEEAAGEKGPWTGLKGIDEGMEPGEGQKRSEAARKAGAKEACGEMPAQREMERPLGEREKEFCRHYAKTLNAFSAALRAGYPREGARAAGRSLLKEEGVRREIERAKAEKNRALLLGAEDLVELHMRIAFADMGDFVSFEWEEEGDRERLRFAVKPSGEMDTQLLAEVKEGKDGPQIKLADRHKSMAFLERYFELDPMDRHKRDCDLQRLALTQKRLEGPEESAELSDGFLEALDAAAPLVWGKEEGG